MLDVGPHYKASLFTDQEYKTRPLKLLQRRIKTRETEQLPARETIYFNKRLAFIDQLPLFL